MRDDDERPVSAVQAAASRHRSSEDDEIEAVLEIYSPRRATDAAAQAHSASPTKRRSSRRLLKKQSTLESEFRMKEVMCALCDQLHSHIKSCITTMPYYRSWFYAGCTVNIG